MSFILKNNPTIINIKLTNAGRKALAEGRLNFTKWAIGDSEIDYSFYNSINFNPFFANILRPKDANPNFIHFIKRNEFSESGDTIYTPLNSVPSVTSVIVNTATERGFFNSSGSTFTFKNDFTIVKQPDAMVDISTINGGYYMTLIKSPNYVANINEPQIGDYILVKWANPNISAGTVNFKVENVATLWYKIEDIISGTLANNNLLIKVDRNLPNFNNYVGSPIYSSVFIYPNSNNRLVSGDSIQNYYGKPYITDFVDESVLTFLENCNCSTVDVPVWNMSIVFTEEIAGVQVGNRNISQYYSSAFGGFIQYIQQLNPEIKKIGIIHYTNNSPSNQYGELLYESTPVLELPTIMWHKRTDGNIGLTLTSDASSRDILPNLNTVYHNLVDQDGNVVGKVFNDLKIFVIEDQELLFAMTYKSNRNWTLPEPIAGFNFTLCPTCSIEIDDDQVIVSGNTIIVNGVTGNIGSLFYKLTSGSVNIIQESNVFTGLSADTYQITVIDTGTPECQTEPVIKVIS